jgi:hypothetical protein
VLELIATCATPRSRIAVRYKLDAFADSIEIPTRVPRTLEGAEGVVSLPYFGNFIGTTVVDRPQAYAVPASVAEHLARHGLPSAEATGESDVEIATITGFGSEGGRKILEASEVGDLRVEWKRATRAFPPGYRLVSTNHRAAAIAVYLCEPESDDGAIENGLLAVPSAGDEFPLWRVC